MLYKFNGKELDEETGLYYYGARYYDPRLSMWLGTDPMLGNNPDVSTYSFCHNNPVIIIDIDGKKDYYISPNGYFYESTSLFEKIKSFLGLSNKSDRVFSEKNRCLLSTYPEGTITKTIEVCRLLFCKRRPLVIAMNVSRFCCIYDTKCLNNLKKKTFINVISE